MDYEVLGAATAVTGTLLLIRHDFRQDLKDLRADLRALNVRIDNVLLLRHADYRPPDLTPPRREREPVGGRPLS